MKKRLKNCLVYTIDGLENVKYLSMIDDKNIFHPAFTLTDPKTNNVHVMYWQIYYTAVILEVIVDENFTDAVGVRDETVTRIIKDYNAEARSVYDGINCFCYEEVFDKMWDELREYVYEKVSEHIKTLSKELDNLPYAQKKINNTSTLIKFGNMLGFLIRIPQPQKCGCAIIKCVRTALLFIDRYGKLYRDNIETINTECETEFNNFLGSIEYPMLVTKENWKTIAIRKI